MSNNNERLAAIIAEKLKEKGLIKSDNTSVETELAKGKLKETEWKIALEEVLNSTEEEANEITQENATE
jgi:PBP1b-binding outer membrane lipoprotein LpoB